MRTMVMRWARGQHYFGRGTGWVKSGGVFWFRVLGFGIYRVRGERPYLLLPGKSPKRNRDPDRWKRVG